MQDDISQLLILNKKANVEQHIFSTELEKYRPHQQRISATIQHQQQAIQELTTAFKDLMEGKEAQNLQSQHDKADRLRRNLTADFNEARSVYNEIKDGLNRGIQFYSGIQDTVDSLQRNIHRFITERANERSRLMDSIESSKSSREQEMLRETLSKYATAPPPPAPLQSAPSSSSMSSTSMSHLTNQTRQMSINEPTAPSSGYTPAPPPKPQAFVQQQQYHHQAPAPLPPTNPSPYGIYGANMPPATYHQPPPSPYAPTPQSPMQHMPPPRPMYNQQQPYQPPPSNYGAPPPSQQQQQQQPPQGYYGNIQAPPPLPQQPQYHHQMPPQQPQYTSPVPQMQGQPHQGYQPQYQQQQQWQQQQPPQQQQQQQQWQQPMYQQQRPPPPPPSSGNLLD